MRSRPLRLILGAVCLAVIAAVVIFVDRSEKTIGSRRAAVRAFDLHAREAMDAFADLRTAQQAYVAAGQGVGFWMPKVDATSELVSSALRSLQQSSTVGSSRTALEEAIAAFVEFGNVDKRIRGYLDSGSQLMAADIVFTEGVESAAKGERDVEHARIEEHLAADAAEADQRRLEAFAGAGAAALLMLVVVTLALTSTRAREPVVPLGLKLSSDEPSARAHTDDLPLRVEGQSDSPDIHPQRPAVSQPVAVTALRTAADVCTDLGRVADSEELQPLLGRAADALGASGLMVWMATAAGNELRAVLAHGYDADMLGRIPAVPRSANNAAATAFRTGALQIILSRPGSRKGAVVAPVLSADGCIGVLSAEIRDGGDATDTVQALAAIFAAQLSGVLAAASSSGEQRATAQG